MEPTTDRRAVEQELGALRRATPLPSDRFGLLLPHLGTPPPSTDMIPSSRSASCWWSGPQFIDPPQDFPKQVPGHGDFGQLERDVPAMAANFGPDLD